ncbi:MAG: right-handed parallel beta-helix repeat-containing protein [bacterium]
MKRLYNSALILFLMLVVAQHATAKIIKVPDEFASINEAIAQAVSGDTIRVSQGTYFEHLEMKKGIVLLGGWKKDFSERDIALYQTIIDGLKGAGSVIYAADNVTIDGFTIMHGTLKKYEAIGEERGSGIYCHGLSNVIIRNNRIVDNVPSAISCSKSSASIINNLISKSKRAGIHLVDGSTGIIEGNEIRENNLAGLSTGADDDEEEDTHAQERYVEMSTFHMKNNRICFNKKAGIDAQRGDGTIFNNIIFKNNESGIRCMEELVKIINNTIVENDMAGIIMHDPNATVIIKNNIIAHNKLTGILTGRGNYDHNLLFHNRDDLFDDPYYLPSIRIQHGGYEDEDTYIQKAHLIADPLFMSMNNEDYHLRPESPAIDAGDPDPQFDDRLFPPSLGSRRNDLGAYGGPFTRPEERGVNSPPIALAGPSQRGYLGDVITLDSAASFDPDADDISYAWYFITIPEGSRAALYNPTSKDPKFKMDIPGKYTVGLTVTDRWGEKSHESQVIIYADDNHPPIAYAGEDLDSVAVGDLIELYADLSTDDDDDPLHYQWSIAFLPSESKATLAGETSPSCRFTIDAPGCYKIKLTAQDGKATSEPHTTFISTMHKPSDKKRLVPQQYPTIQSAVDAAEPGDQIIVTGGTYKENILIDKRLDMIGIDWPIVDGGSKEGNVDTIKIAYLGNDAGKVTGFVISGSGRGLLAHGLSAWDSSPEIYHNRFTKNPHNAIGIHGSKHLTGETRVYENLIYDNGGGIGNGKGGCGQIYNNEIFNNKVFGIGCRGYSAPIIRDNYIHDNFLGIGMREPVSPFVENNYIYNNVSGIRISPVSTIEVLPGNEIVIKNNLIINNEYNGIWATSFNRANLTIVHNTIDHNNLARLDRRGGGVVFGYPWPGDFKVILKNNIITNNYQAGILNYRGSEDFIMEAKGVVIENDYNNVWNNGQFNYIHSTAGANDMSQDPLYISSSTLNAPLFRYFLSNKKTKHTKNSPCVNVKSTLINPALQLDLNTRTTQVDLKANKTRIDMGFHYPLDIRASDWIRGILPIHQ